MIVELSNRCYLYSVVPRVRIRAKATVYSGRNDVVVGSGQLDLANMNQTFGLSEAE